MTPSPVAPLVAPPDRTAAHVMEELEAAIIAGALDVNNRRLDHQHVRENIRGTVAEGAGATGSNSPPALV